MKFELDAFNRNVTDEELLQDLVAVDAKLKMLGHRLTFRSFGKLGKYSAYTIALRFGSWMEKSRANPERGKKYSNRGTIRQSKN